VNIKYIEATSRKWLARAICILVLASIEGTNSIVPQKNILTAKFLVAIEISL